MVRPGPSLGADATPWTARQGSERGSSLPASPRYDVVIAGYGPVGAVLANLLGNSSLRVLVVEKDREIFDKPRAIGLDGEVMRTFQHIGVAHEVAPLTRIYPGTKYLGVDGDEIKFIGQMPPPYPLGWAGSSFIQPELEDILRRNVQQLPSVEVLLGSTLEAIERLPDGTVGMRIVDAASGTSSPVCARYLLGCDGARSTVRKFIGASLEDCNFDQEWLVVDAWLRDEAQLPPEGRQYCWPSRPATYVIGPRNMRRWEIKLLEHESAADFESIESVIKVLQPFVETSKIDIWRRSVYRFHALVASSWRDGPIFILGDAAHQTPPFMGQGMCSGIRDAANLAWKILMVEEGTAGPELLDTYQTELRPHVTAVIQAAMELGQIIGEMDEARARARDAALRAQGTTYTVRGNMIPPLRHGLINSTQSPQQAKAVGTLFVQPRVRTAAGTALLDDLLGARRFVLVTAGSEASRWIDDGDLDAWREIGGQRVAFGVEPDQDDPEVHGVLEEGNLFGDWAAQFGAQAVIVRPDRYVYGVASNRSELQALVRELRAGLGRSSESPASQPALAKEYG